MATRIGWDMRRPYCQSNPTAGTRSSKSGQRRPNPPPQADAGDTLPAYIDIPS